MPAKKRRELIEQRIRTRGEIDFASLASEFAVSEMTIRRDVDALEDKGVLRRVLGGAISMVGKSTEPTFEARAAQAATEKAHMADAVIALLQPNETVILDSGSTVLAVAGELRGRELGLTVVTPSLLVATELADDPGTTVLLAGGQVRAGELSLIGTETESAFALYNCDAYVMGIAGVDARRGITEYHREEANVKKAAMAASDRVIVVADMSKLGRVQLMNVASFEQITALVTDGPPEHPAVRAARKAGVDVVHVPHASQERRA
ncbi:MAG: DeoR/GlpR family DNA-binding transcription regulator [Schumannella sp.]